jgi:DNA-binding transcriptional LysR family regulator
LPAEQPAGAPAQAAASITDLRLLECFVAVAEERHVGRAAQRLGIGQAALSRSVTQLERRLGVELLARATAGLQLTPTGEAMLARSVELLGRHEAVVQEIRRLGRQHPTSLRVVVDDGFAGLLLAAAIREYRDIAPDAEVSVRSAPYGASAAELLADGSADFALVGIQPLDPGTRSVIVGACRRVVVAAVDHRLAQCDFISLPELAGEAELRASAAAAADWTMQWSIAGLIGEPALGGGDFTLFTEALDLVAAGHGILLAPDFAQRRFARADLCWIPLTGPDPAPVHLAWRRRNVPRTRAEAFATAFERAGADLHAPSCDPELEGVDLKAPTCPPSLKASRGASAPEGGPVTNLDGLRQAQRGVQHTRRRGRPPLGHGPAGGHA